MENSFLSEFKEREYFNQCTNSEELEQLMSKKKIKAYIGFDCTAVSYTHLTLPTKRIV